jgi:mRNA interferase MazF
VTAAPPAYRQLEIWWIDPEPVKGAETQKQRPCVVVQADLVNLKSRTVIVAPLLPGHKDWPFAVNIEPSRENGLDKERHVNVKQVRAVDASQFSNVSSHRQGVLEKKYLQPIHAALKTVFGIE